MDDVKYELERARAHLAQARTMIVDDKSASLVDLRVMHELTQIDRQLRRLIFGEDHASILTRGGD